MPEFQRIVKMIKISDNGQRPSKCHDNNDKDKDVSSTNS